VYAVARTGKPVFMDYSRREAGAVPATVINDIVIDERRSCKKTTETETCKRPFWEGVACAAM
jgi:hypothetical protein